MLYIIPEAYHLEAYNSGSQLGIFGTQRNQSNLLPYMDPRNHKRDARECSENLEVEINNSALQQSTVL